MEIDADVLQMVRKQLDRDPPPPTTALYGRATRINSDIYQLTLRQFHAKYPLRVKRERARAARDGSAGSPGNGASMSEEGRVRARDAPSTRGDGEDETSPGPRDVRAGIRKVLVEVAREAVRAQGPTGGVEVVAAVEGHVDRLVRLLARAEGGDAWDGEDGPGEGA